MLAFLIRSVFVVVVDLGDRQEQGKKARFGSSRSLISGKGQLSRDLFHPRRIGIEYVPDQLPTLQSGIRLVIVFPPYVESVTSLVLGFVGRTRYVFSPRPDPEKVPHSRKELK